MHFDDSKLHHVAAKCGVFAETDIVNLIKSGIPSNEVLCSLADAIVLQNLSVLTRGNTLKHRVLLLGGPNTYLPFLQECWRLRIPQTWEERGYDYPKDMPDRGARSSSPRTRSTTPRSARCCTASTKPAHVGWLTGTAELVEYITTRAQGAPRRERRVRRSSKDEQELVDFRELYKIPKFSRRDVRRRARWCAAVIGLDGGSTSSKAVLVDYEDGKILGKAYQLSKGNPIQDTKELLAQLAGTSGRPGRRSSR